MENYYEILHLAPNASLDEVKASFRRLAKQYHPDAGPNGDAVLFNQIHEAYEALLARQKDGGPKGHTPQYFGSKFHSVSRPRSADGFAASYGGRSKKPNWRFEGVSDRGADVVYVLRLSRDALAGLNLVLPWKAEEACPACLGQGRAPGRRGTCPKCNGDGVIKRNSSVHVDLTAEMIRQGGVRMKGLGKYRPDKAVRGDLVIEVLADRQPFQRYNNLFAA